MAQLPNPFDPNQYDPNDGAQGMPISGPNGYLVKIKDTSWVPSGDGKARLVFSLEVCEGEHAGYVGSYGLNLEHPNAQTVEIAKRELTSLCYVLGIFNPVADTSVMHGKQFKACVRQQKKSPEYTEIHKVLDVHGRTATDIKNAGPASVAAPAAGPTMAPAAPPAPPAPAAVPPAAAPAAPPQAPPAAPAAPAAPPTAPTPPAAPAAPVGAPAPAPAAPPAAPPPAAPGQPMAPGAVPPWDQG